MEFLIGDSDFGTEFHLVAISETGEYVDHDIDAFESQENRPAIENNQA